LLFRKAAEYYDPEARDILAQVYAMIAENELKMNRPVAARAALKIALHCQPANQELRDSMAAIYGDKSQLPFCARREYSFLPLPATAPESRRQAWESVLAKAGSGKLGEVAGAFEQITGEDPDNAAGWYNRGLTRAWLGDNKAAIEALDRYIELEKDETKAAAAGALAEVLRSGHGVEEEANYFEDALMFQIRDPNALAGLLNSWGQQGRLVGMQQNEEQGFLTAMVVEQLPNLTPALAANRVAGIGAYLLVAGGIFRLWHTNAEALAKIHEEVQQKVGQSLSPPRAERRSPAFPAILAEAIGIPARGSDQAESIRRLQEHVYRYFEEIWIHRPLRSLNGIPPIDAAGHANLRKKLLGAIQFLQDCAAFGPTKDYDFERLRRKLGLLGNGQAAPVAGAAMGPDIGAMGAPELAALAPDSLSERDLELAFQTALKVDAREIAERFAQALAGRPPQADRPDRYAVYSFMIQKSLADGNLDEALNQVDRGEKADCEQNEGRRRNEYELRRGQIHAKRGAFAEATGIFDRLIARVPSELKYRGSAAEALLSARQGTQALRYAEEGLAQARKQNDRDSEGYFMELVEAAKRQK